MEMENSPALKVSDMKVFSAILPDISGIKIVYVGENHDNYAHHLVQLETIKAMYRENRRLAIGMEMFQTPFQQAVDDYISGKSDQKTFLKKTEYFRRWGFDYYLYKPVIDYARENRIPIVALNIEREVVERVSQTGIEALPADLRSKIPTDMDFSDVLYRQRLEQVYAEHDSMKDRKFEHFYQSQILWDEYMAQSIAGFLKAHPEYRIVVLAGNGHLTYGSGIPKRTYRRNSLGYAVILNGIDPDKGIADYLVFPKQVEPPKPAKLMILLKDEKGRLVITDFPENSVSKKAGLEKNDVIVAIDNIPVGSIDDLRIYLLQKKIGDNVTVDILRKDKSGIERRLQFKITL